jgi:DNA (cytosine-5)-methyltransferase 1
LRARSKSDEIPVVDVFAGPGGLSEGFSAFRGSRGERFRVVLSLEKDAAAHRTLLLRSFFRQFDKAPEAYYARVRGELSSEELFAQHPVEYEAALKEVLPAPHELGRRSHQNTRAAVASALGRSTRRWVLIGGPPCQAYSLIGRSRMRGTDPDAFAADHRHFLYREYLRLLREFRPPVFVFENVRGLLSSTVRTRAVFDGLLKDFRKAGYALHSFVRLESEHTADPEDFLIRCEEYGVPQTRHRVIILGLRQDLERGNLILTPVLQAPSALEAIGDLPAIRSGLTRRENSQSSWIAALRETLRYRMPESIRREMGRALRRELPASQGTEFIPRKTGSVRAAAWLQEHSGWFLDRRLDGVVHHVARPHMSTDIARYFFAATFASVHARSPKLRDFPRRLLPAHRNAADAAASGSGLFADRFRVQVGDRPATTVVSHMSKDGHYFIHPDPAQARSLTVREAARLQTFPDNYFFEGNRTSRYQQVGNAVPPLLARQLAAVVIDILSQIRC